MKSRKKQTDLILSPFPNREGKLGSKLFAKIKGWSALKTLWFFLQSVRLPFPYREGQGLGLRPIFILVSLFSMLTLSGCWDLQEVTLGLPDNGKISLRNARGKSSLKVSISKENTPHFLVNIKVNGSLSDLTNNLKELSPEEIRKLELGIQRVLVKKISAVIKKLQSYNSDIINFGEELRVQHQDLWKQLKWKQTFPTVPFRVVVKAKIERDGVLR